MSANAFAPDSALALPGAAAAAVAWRARGTLYVTVIAKATFAFASDAPMPWIDPQEIVRAEVHHGKNPGRSVCLTSDLAPALARADVVFTGDAHAPPGARVTSLPVRLALFSGQRPLLDKWLLVNDPGGVTRLPVVYERTCLGLDDTENPFGLATTAGVPCIVDPARPERPAGFGPLGRAWPARKRLLRGVARTVLEGPIAEIPDGFDGSYFQAAPPDQRTELLRGDEWIILEGLHPALPRFRTRLPAARAAARIHGLSAFGVPEGHLLELHADTLRIDGKAQQCTVVWRRWFPVPGEAALGAVRLVAGVAIGGEALPWIDPARAPARAPDAGPPRDANAQQLASTQASPASTVAPDPALDDGAPARVVLPFTTAPPGQPSPPVAPAPVERVFTGTLHLPSSEDEEGVSDPRDPTWVAPPASEPLPAWASFDAAGSKDDDPTGVLPAKSTPPLEPEPASFVPYFVPSDPPAPKEPEPPPAPSAPEPPLPDLPLERFAALSAKMHGAHKPPREILLDEAVTEPAWAAAERRWTEALKVDAKRGNGALVRAYDSAYVAAVEDLRGPILPEEYARTVVARERGESDGVLDALRLPRPALMPVLRLWTRKASADPKLFRAVGAALARLRSGGAEGP